MSTLRTDVGECGKGSGDWTALDCVGGLVFVWSIGREIALDVFTDREL